MNLPPSTLFAALLLCSPVLGQTPGLELDGSSRDFFGLSMAAYNDITGDGIPEIWVAAVKDEEFGSSRDTGAVHLFDGDDGDLLLSIYGDEPDGRFGRWITVGSVTSDSRDDLIVGAAQETNPHIGNGFYAGTVYMFAGWDIENAYFNGDSLDARYHWHGDGDRDKLGRVVAIVGDIDGNGRDDIIAGAYEPALGGSSNGPGYVRAFSGRDGSVHWTTDWTRGPLADGTFFGVSASGLDGDINNDGIDDIIVGAFGLSGGRKGGAFVISGADGSNLTIAPGALVGDRSGDELGRTVQGLDDLNNDGVPEFVVGAHFVDAPGGGSKDKTGAAYLYSGATQTRIATYFGDAPGDHFGNGMAVLGDVNDDGRDDFAVAGSTGSLVKVISGRSPYPVIATIVGPFGDAFGHGVAGFPDVDDNDNDEILIGDPLWDAGGSGKDHGLMRRYRF